MNEEEWKRITEIFRYLEHQLNDTCNVVQYQSPEIGVVSTVQDIRIEKDKIVFVLSIVDSTLSMDITGFSLSKDLPYSDIISLLKTFVVFVPTHDWKADFDLDIC